MKRFLGILSHLSFALLIGQQAHGWGGNGHRVIAEITGKNLHPSVQKQINLILEGESLDKAANWPDSIKWTTGWKHTKNYHYRSIDSGTYYDALKKSSAADQKKGDILRALVKAEDVLLSSSQSKANKKNALRFLIHMIGDIHQPLHVGYYDDVGGNTIGMDWYGDKTNLHSVWDSGIIYQFTKKTAALNGAFNAQAYSQYLRKPSTGEIKQWQTSHFMAWLNEALALRDAIYVNHNAANDTYFNKSLSPMHERLLQAGHRTAGYLNNLFLNPNLFANERAALKKNLTAVLGKANDVDISLSQRSAREHDHFEEEDEDSCSEEWTSF